MTDLDIRHLELPDLEAGLDEIRRAPRDDGCVTLIVRRPDRLERETLDEGQLDTEAGLVGDSWRIRGSNNTPDGAADPRAQVTVMGMRVIRLLAAGRADRWALAGDQLYVDFDLSAENIPPGTLLAVGDAVIEVSEMQRTGCKKFAERFGQDGVRFVSTPLGRSLDLRGINAGVVVSGTVRRGARVSRL